MPTLVRVRRAITTESDTDTDTDADTIPVGHQAERHPRRRRVRGRRPGPRLAALGCVAALSLSPSSAVAASSGSTASPASRSSDAPAPALGFAWPVSPHEVARTFDPPEVVWGAGHRGVDLRSTPGADVRAPADGVVIFSGSVAGRGVLTVRHPQGFDTTYEPVSAQLPRGTQVKRGERIATLEPGHCEPACLHWGYRVGPKSYRDPLTLVSAVRPVLLPPL